MTMMQTYQFKMIRKGDLSRSETVHGWASTEPIARKAVTAQYGGQWDIGPAIIVPGVRVLGAVDCSDCK